MNFFLVEQIDHVSIATGGSPNAFCLKKLKENDRACKHHYSSVFQASPAEGKFSRCPYGYHTSSHIPNLIPRMAVSGIGVKRAGAKRELEELERARDIFMAVNFAAGRVHRLEYSLLEDALHEVRHTNARIKIAAEEQAATDGIDVEKVASEVDRYEHSDLPRSLAIYLASEDVSSTLDIFEFARKPTDEPWEREFINFRDLFKLQVVTSFALLRRRKLVVKIEGAISPRELSIATKFLPRILLDNAIKYSSTESEILVTLFEKEDSFGFSVSNYGKTIAEPEREMVFRRGTRGSNCESHAGAGVGLWIARSIASLESGSVTLDLVKGSETPGFGITRLVVVYKKFAPPIRISNS
jgi:signal transduction histidine kinase